jgi:hypothetical protein
MQPVDHLAHLAHHRHWLGVAVAIWSSVVGTWICIWVAIFSSRKNTDASEAPDDREPGSLQKIARKKSPDRRTNFRV